MTETLERPDVHKAGQQTRTKDQCTVAMMRFHPACNLYEVLTLLSSGGYKTSRTNDGVIWIEKEPT